MIYSINNELINLEYIKEEIDSKNPLFFFHGFFGSLEDWKFVLKNIPSNYTPIFIDLIGHGKSSSPDNEEKYTSHFQVELIKIIIDKLSLTKISIVGYSMGGRLALSFAIKYPHLISNLILESTAFGYDNNNDKNERINKDRELALKISKSSLEQFSNYWSNLALFDSLKKIKNIEYKNFIKNRIGYSNLIGLKNSLLGFSTGYMENYLEYINDFKKPVLLIAGEFDEKFTKIALKAHHKFPNSKLVIIKDCGHNVHLEKSEEFLKLLHTFLTNV